MSFVIVAYILFDFSLLDLLTPTHVPNDKSSGTHKIENPEDLSAFQILFFGDIPKFNPISPDGLYVWQLQALVWDRFVEIDKNKVWHPSLAQNWQFNKDQTELKLYLRPNIKWSNGRELTTQDILFSLNFFKIRSLKGALFQPLLERIDSFDFKGSELILKLSENKNKNPTYASLMYWSEILSSLRLLPYDLETNPYLGTGLYQVSEFSSTKPWSLTLNPESWYLQSDLSLKWPEIIKIKTFKSASVLNSILSSLLNSAVSSPSNLEVVSPSDSALNSPSNSNVNSTENSNLNSDVNLDSKTTNNSTLNTLAQKQDSALTMGVDLAQIGLNPKDLSQNAFDDKVFTKAIRFNLKKVPLKIRKQLETYIFENNDLQKMNLVDKFRGFQNFNFDNNPYAIGDFKRDVELPTSLPAKKIYKKFKDSELYQIEVLYTHQEDSQWLSYLSEKLKFEGYKLEAKLVSSAVFNEQIYNRKFEAYVSDYESESFYPLYLSYHSKGEYNHEGWSSPTIDKNLEKLIFAKDAELIAELSKKIRIEMNQNYFEIPIFSYKSSVLWTRNVCNPIQQQFQGLGLIYKAIICADNL